MVQDILLDDDNDILIKDGDLVVGDSKYQHVKLILESEKGYWKFSPTKGAALQLIVQDEFNSEEIIRNIRFELEQDGFKFTKIQFNNVGKLDIEGDYDS